MISHIDRRLQAWGRWVQLGRGMGSKGLSAQWGEPGGGGVHGALIPIQSIDSSRMHDWVMTLAKADQQLLVMHYCTPHAAIDQARRLRMSLRTMYSRLHELHAQYGAHEQDRRDRRPK